MTKLTERKSKLIFETADTVRQRGRHREIIVEPHPLYVVLRLKGTRQRLTRTWEGIYTDAAKSEAERVKAERKKRKRGILG